MSCHLSEFMSNLPMNSSGFASRVCARNRKCSRALRETRTNYQTNGKKIGTSDSKWLKGVQPRFGPEAGKISLQERVNAHRCKPSHHAICNIMQLVLVCCVCVMFFPSLLQQGWSLFQLRRSWGGNWEKVVGRCSGRNDSEQSTVCNIHAHSLTMVHLMVHLFHASFSI